MKKKKITIGNITFTPSKYLPKTKEKLYFVPSKLKKSKTLSKYKYLEVKF